MKIKKSLYNIQVVGSFIIYKWLGLLRSDGSTIQNIGAFVSSRS